MRPLDALPAVDVVVIGAGVIGCAVARVLSHRGLQVYLLEADAAEGQGLTSRNSGVVHSGLYYPPDSRKAQSCIRGQELLWDWVDQRGVPHRITGKLVVARDSAEVTALHALYDNACAAGAKSVERISGRAVSDMEPGLPVTREALYCARTGIVDPVAFTRSLRRDAEAAGATVLFGARVRSLETGPPFYLETSRGPICADIVVNAGGLNADRLAHSVAPDLPDHHACRGDYFRLRGGRTFNHLIYPMRAAGDPGLGIHLTLDLAGGVRLGPDSEWVDDRADISSREDKRARFLEAAERLIGPVDPWDLVWDGCGIRPKLRRPDEPEDRDFLIEESPDGCFHLLGIESPGLTSSMALAEELGVRLGS